MGDTLDELDFENNPFRDVCDVYILCTIVRLTCRHEILVSYVTVVLSAYLLVCVNWVLSDFY